MNLIDLITHRYSVRKFLDKPVEQKKIESCIEAARLAPSACNSQPWSFIVVDDPELKNELCDKIFSIPYQMNQFAKSAPALIFVVSEKSTFFAKVGGVIRNTQYYLIDIGIAVEHLVLQASELGLGTCWIGWFNEKEAKKILKLPTDKKIDVMIPIGYPALPEHPKVRKSFNEIFSYFPHKP